LGCKYNLFSEKHNLFLGYFYLNKESFFPVKSLGYLYHE